MTTQPKASRLSDELERHHGWYPTCTESAAELRRLSAVEAQRDALLEALKMMTAHYCNLVNSGDAGNWEPDAEPEVQIARAAIKAVEEGK